MPLPLAFIGGAAVGSGVGLASNIFGSYLSAAFEPGVYNSKLAAWAKDPVALPSPEAMLSAYQRGLLTANEATHLLRATGCNYFGVPLSDGPRFSSQMLSHMGWRAMARTMQNRPEPSTLTHAFFTKRISQKDYSKWMKLANADLDSWLDIRHMYRNLPSVEQLFLAKTRTFIEQDTLEKGLQLQGAAYCDWVRLEQLFRTIPTVGELNVGLNRGLIMPGVHETRLRQLGFSDNEDLQMLTALREVYPSVSDLITMQRREVFTPKLATSLGLYDEVPTEAHKWLAKQGLFGGPGFRITSDGKERDANWSDLLWGMSWLRLSPTMTFEAVRRLRPGRVQRWVDGLKEYLKPILSGEFPVDADTMNEARNAEAELDKLKPFTVGDAFKELRVADWPKSLRPLLLALTFTPLRLIDIRNAYISGARDREWFIEQQLDRGIAPDDANTLADIQDNAALLAVRRRNIAIQAAAPAQWMRSSLAAFKQGVISEAEAKNSIEIFGVDEGTADLMINRIKLEVRTDLHKRAMRTLGRQYVSGEWSRAETLSQLEQIGIDTERGNQYLALWDMERTKTRKQLTTAKIQNYVRDGLLDVPSAIRRLDNLGWSDGDRLLLLSEAQAASVKAREREAATAERSRRAAAKEMEKAIDELEETRQRVAGELRRLTPVSKLQKWLKNNIIKEEFFNRRMARMGFPERIIARYRAEAIGNGQQANAGTDEE